DESPLGAHIAPPTHYSHSDPLLSPSPTWPGAANTLFDLCPRNSGAGRVLQPSSEGRRSLKVGLLQRFDLGKMLRRVQFDEPKDELLIDAESATVPDWLRSTCFAQIRYAEELRYLSEIPSLESVGGEQ